MMENILIEAVKEPVLADATPRKQTLSLFSRFSKALDRIANFNIHDLADRLASGLAKRANAQNVAQVKAAYKDALGIDMTKVINNSSVKEHVELALKENVALIKSIQTDFIADIGKHVFSNLHETGRHENLISLIRERGQVSQSRAKFIARDQTSKLNAALTRARNESLGIDLYLWGGAGDERERDSHFVLNNKLCKYSDPTVYSDDDGKTWKNRRSIGAYEGDPGTDYQCRCTAIPYIKWD